ncbi:OmpW family outer membrane protein [uncultured Psychroserpens sp.]|uniref:OmpW family outer membrane protein n=1 Tax=uncultured Psychroserpens sp. TaxID=255436 RepID=UPI002614B917|nr:OmpW family outer membrane protein [uncultured Psychroserpens sp.]
MTKQFALCMLLSIFMSVNLIFAQNNLSGKLTLNDKTYEGVFSNKINNSTKTLTFNSEEGTTFNVSNTKGAILYYFSTKETYATLEEKGQIVFAEVLSNGNVKFYKTLIENTYFIENSKNKTGAIQLTNVDDVNSYKANRGKLLVIFKDCVEARKMTNNNVLSRKKIMNIINVYNECSNYSDEYQLTSKEASDQNYIFAKGIINFDIGIGYYLESSDLNIPTYIDASDNTSGLSIYASVNISPRFVKNLIGKFYFDLGVQYNFNASSEVDNKISQDISSIFITLTPKYYFKEKESQFNPYIGLAFGAALISYDVLDLNQNLFTQRKGSNTRFIYGLELGTTIMTNFEASLVYYPDFQNDIKILEQNELSTKKSNLSFRLGYKFN